MNHNLLIASKRRPHRVTIRLAPVTLILLVAALPLRANDSAPMTLEQYRTELRRTEAAIQDQRDHFNPPAGKPEVLNVQLPVKWVMEVEGTRYEISTDDLKFKIEDNKDRAANRKIALNGDLDRIHALLAESENLGANRQQSSATARPKLDEILSRREFGGSQEKKSWIRELWDRISGWIIDFLFRLFQGVRKSKVVTNTILYSVIAIGFVALAWALVRVYLGASRRESLRLEQPATTVKTSSQWAREAAAAASRGDYRNAVRCGYWAGVYRLSEIGAVDLDESRTPREYLRILARRGGASRLIGPGDSLPDPAVAATRATALGELTRRFESVWYADVPASPQDFDSTAANLEKLECRLPLTAPTASS